MFARSSRPVSRLVLAFVVVTACSSARRAGEDAGGVEVPAGDALIVLVAGAPSHGPGEHEYNAGLTLLRRMLVEQPGVAATVVRGWPTDPGIFADARSIVFFADGNGAHPLVQGDRLATVAAQLAKGAGLACLHFAVHFPDDFAPRILPLLGGYYSDAISVNPIWSASFAANTTHPIRRGVPAFDSRDEWYFNIRFAPETDRITPILQALPPDDLRFTPDAAQHAGRRETVAWTFNRSDGGRSFGFTGGHFHDNWGNEPFRRTIVNAVLWTAGIDIPTAGAAANIDPAWLRQNLDPKGQ